MRVHFERIGGFAGIRLKADVDTEAMSAEDSKTLRTLVDNAQLHNVGGSPHRGVSKPDTFEYVVTVEDDGKRTSARMTDGTMPSSVQPLVSHLLALARKPKTAP